MIYLIKIASKPSYWSGKPDAVWTDQVLEGKNYSTKKEAEKEVKEIYETSGYTLEVIKYENATAE